MYVLLQKWHHFMTKVLIIKVMVFPVVMYGCETQTIKKSEYWRTDAFKLWCWRKLLKVPWTVRRLNQSILKEINLEYSLETLMLKLSLQYFDHLTRRLEKLLMLGKTEGKRRRGRQKTRWLENIADSVDMNLSKLQELVKNRIAWSESDMTYWLNNNNNIKMNMSIILVAQMLKNMPEMQKTQVWSLGLEDPLEKGMASVFLPGEFHGQRSLVGYSQGIAKTWIW